MTLSPVYGSSSHSFMAFFTAPLVLQVQTGPPVCERRWRQGQSKDGVKDRGAVLVVDVGCEPQTPFSLSNRFGDP